MDFIPWAKPNFWENEIKYVNEALESTWISGGKFVEKFENDFSKEIGTEHALTTSNGTTSLHLAYIAIDLKPGDEIIVPGFAFMAVANIALNMGVKPVFAEVDSDTWCLSASEIERKITKKTKAIIPVHTYGNVCQMDEIMNLGTQKKLIVIEDCAESLFSKYKNKYCGVFGHINSYSFQATKTITTGEGGMVTTSDSNLYDKMVLIRSHGLTERGRYYHQLPGYNFRLTNLQAAMGLAQFEQKEKILSERKRVHLLYKKLLNNIEGITLQTFNPEVEAVLWAFVIKLDKNAFPQGRNKVMQQLKLEGIETRPGFVASSQLDIYEQHQLPISENISNNTISLPTFPTLTNTQIEYVCDKFLKLKK